MVAPFIAIEGNNMTFGLWKLGLQADRLTVTMIFSCLFVDTQNLFMLLFVQNYKYLNK